MFNYLKKKLKSAVDSLSGQAEEHTTVKKAQEEETVQPKQKTQQSVSKPKKQERTLDTKTTAKPPKNSQEEKKEESSQKQKKSFISRVSEKITTVQLSNEQFEDAFFDLEIALLENNVAQEVVDKIKQDLQEELTTSRTSRGGVQERIYDTLQHTITELLDVETIDVLKYTNKHQPLVIAAVGVNGSGKTTSLAKLAHYFQQHNKSVVLAACDTFRAAAIQQLEEHARNLDIPIIKQDYGSDAAAVAYDAIKSAKAKGIDVVLLDTAGRLHSNKNLMDELQKVVRIAQPHLTLFVGEATTGNDCVLQAKQFQEVTDIDGIILTKADVDEQGGAAVSMSYVTNKPILFLGTGQDYTDLVEFDKELLISQLLD